MVSDYITDLPFKEITDMLTRSPIYKVLHNFNKIDQYNPANNKNKFIDIFLDIEIKGLDKSKDKIIELLFINYKYDKIH